MRLGHDVHVVGVEDARSSVFHVHRIRVPANGAVRYLLAAPGVLRTVRRLAPDVVDIHGVSTYGLYGLLPLGAPFIATIYGTDIYEAAPNSRMIRVGVRRLLRNAAFIYGSSATIRDYVEDAIGIDITDRIRLRSWGVPIFRLTADAANRRRRVREEFGLDPETRVVVHCRQIMESWRVRAIVQAVPSVLARHPNTKFWFVYPPLNAAGEELLRDLKALAVELHVRDAVQFLPPQPYDRFISVLHASDVFLCVGKHDLLASSLLEALATGLVPVLSTLPAYREVVENGVNGYFVPTPTGEELAPTLIRALDMHDEKGSRMRTYNQRLMELHYDETRCTEWLVDQLATITHDPAGARVQDDSVSLP